MYTTLIEKGEKSSHPHNLRAPLPPSLHPPPSLFPPLVINLPMLPALLSVLSFCAHANSEHIPCHFLALFKNACLFLIFHCVSLGNKLAAFQHLLWLSGRYVKHTFDSNTLKKMNSYTKLKSSRRPLFTPHSHSFQMFTFPTVHSGYEILCSRLPDLTS